MYTWLDIPRRCCLLSQLKVKAQSHIQNTSSNKCNRTTTLHSTATKPIPRPANDYCMLNCLYSLANVHEVKQFIHNIEFWLNSIPSGVYIAPCLQYKYTYMTSYEILKAGSINMNAGSRGGLYHEKHEIQRDRHEGFCLTQNRVQFVLNMLIISSQFTTILWRSDSSFHV